MKAPVVIFTIGNPSRGDDAIGPELGRQLAEGAEALGLAASFELVEDFQLQIEHVIDLNGRQLALFIDAGQGTPSPLVFRRIQPSTVVAHTTHALAPEAVLQVFRQTERLEPPPAFVLCVRGESFELGEGLSEGAVQHVATAYRCLLQLLQHPSLSAWEGLALSLASTGLQTA